jgi:urease accessory protein
MVLAADERGTALKHLHQSGAAKIRLPHRHGRAAMEAVLINTSGGLAGGDRLDWGVEVEPGAQAVVTTQACERAYRSLGDAARVTVSLTVGAGGRIDWLPQETILYDDSALERRLDADVGSGGTLLVAEAVLLGRLAHGERVRNATFHDRWRIRRGGRLVFAENTRLDGQVDAIAARAATLGGAAAYATVLLLAEETQRLLEPVRARLSGHNDIFSGASAFDGKLICRIVAQDGLQLRRVLTPVLEVLRGGLGLPRVWTN